MTRMEYRGAVEKGQPLVVECRADAANPRQMLLTVQEYPEAGPAPRPAIRVIAPSSSAEVQVTPNGAAVRVQVDVPDPGGRATLRVGTEAPQAVGDCDWYFAVV